jgi:hypothetical protein
MMSNPKITSDSSTITVQVPISIRVRGGRRRVLAPDGTPMTNIPIRREIDSPIIKAIARAYRWRKMLEAGKYATVREMAWAENISESYLGRVLRLTLLAPDIVEAILNGHDDAQLHLDGLMKRFPIEWHDQRAALQKPRV